MEKIRIVVTGKTFMGYNRTQILLQALKKRADVEVVELPILKKKAFDIKAFQKEANQADFIYLPPFTHSSIGKIRKWTRTPIVFDPLISKYLTKVIDYGQWWKTPINYLKDLWAFKKADIVIADTEHHKHYYSTMFGIPLERIFVIPLGVNCEEFTPTLKTANDGVFRVGFYGSFVPLQGAEKIVEAANLLKTHADIRFQLIGTGYTYEKTKQLIKKYGLTNIQLMGWLPYDQLSSIIANFDLCLGIFGDSLKTDIVVPNKAFHYAAMRKCMITKDTPGIKEVFTDHVNAIFCKADAKSMVEKILQLKNNTEVLSRVGNNALQLVKEKYDSPVLGQSMVDILKTYKASILKG